MGLALDRAGEAARQALGPPGRSGQVGTVVQRTRWSSVFCPIGAARGIPAPRLDAGLERVLWGWH